MNGFTASSVNVTISAVTDRKGKSAPAPTMVHATAAYASATTTGLDRRVNAETATTLVPILKREKYALVAANVTVANVAASKVLKDTILVRMNRIKFNSVIDNRFYFPGKYCEECPTCRTQCEALKECVQCQGKVTFFDCIKNDVLIIF